MITQIALFSSRVKKKDQSHILSSDYKEERDTEPKDGWAVKDKEYVTDLSKTAKIQCISAQMGMGKTFALKKHIESLPQEVRICILFTRITYSDAQHLDLFKQGLEFTHYKGENSRKL